MSDSMDCGLYVYGQFYFRLSFRSIEKHAAFLAITLKLDEEITIKWWKTERKREREKNQRNKNKNVKDLDK